MKRFSALIFATLVLGSCEQRVAVVTPEIESSMISDLRGGRAVLDCWITCSATWANNLSELNRRYTQQEWRKLATLVMQIGFQEDLSYYYLGRSAEGLGAPDAALKYYRIAGALGTGSDKRFRCSSIGFDLCNGLSFPKDLYPRMRLAQRLGSRSYAQGTPAVAPVASGDPAPAEPKTKAAAAGAEEGWIDPPPVTR